MPGEITRPLAPAGNPIDRAVRISGLNPQAAEYRVNKRRGPPTDSDIVRIQRLVEGALPFHLCRVVSNRVKLAFRFLVVVAKVDSAITFFLS